MILHKSEGIIISIKLIAIDVDGTLVNSKKELTAHVKEVVLKAKEKGVKVVICTGRPVSGVSFLLKALNLENQSDQYVICFGGAMLQTTSGKVISLRPISYDDYVDLEALSRKINIHFHALAINRIYTSNRDIGYYTLYEANHVSLGISYRTPEEMKNIEMIKGMFVGEADILDAAISNHEPFDALADRLEFTKSSPFYYEANAKGVTKGSALKKLSAHLGIEASEVMAIGDEANDLSMIGFAGTGIAMGNAIPALREVAQYVTLDNDHDGVAAAIDKFVLNT